MKYSHYSPKAKVILVQGRDTEKFRKIVEDYKSNGIKTASIGFKESYCNFNFYGSVNKINKNLFRIFRESDKQDINVIFVKAVAEKELGLALMNRVKKASSETIKI
jgi:L-threonylcarbamoyladenylate synthase